MDFVSPASFENEMLPLILVLRFHHNLLILLLLPSEILFLLSLTLFHHLGFLCCQKSWDIIQDNYSHFLCSVIFYNLCHKKITQKIHSNYFVEFHFKTHYFLRWPLFQIYDLIICSNCL